MTHRTVWAWTVARLQGKQIVETRFFFKGGTTDAERRAREWAKAWVTPGLLGTHDAARKAVLYREEWIGGRRVSTKAHHQVWWSENGPQNRGARSGPVRNG